MIGAAFALLAMSAREDRPGWVVERDVSETTHLHPQQYDDLHADYLDDLVARARQERYDLGGVEHTHTGRLCNQYAKQPRSNAGRICRGRP